MNNNNNNLNEPFDANRFLEIFRSLHHRDDIAPYPRWAADNQYYGIHYNTFLQYVTELYNNNNNDEFNRIYSIVSNPIHGRTDLLTAIRNIRNIRQINRVVGGHRLRVSKKNGRKMRKRSQRKFF